MDYQIHTKKEILNSAIASRERSRVFVLFFEMKHLKFGLIYDPWFSKGEMALAHVNFYAMSRGFENLTSSGYRSMWISNANRVVSYKEMERYCRDTFKDKVVFDTEKQPMQLGLF